MLEVTPKHHKVTFESLFCNSLRTISIYWLWISFTLCFRKAVQYSWLSPYQVWWVWEIRRPSKVPSVSPWSSTNRQT